MGRVVWLTIGNLFKIDIGTPKHLDEAILKNWLCAAIDLFSVKGTSEFNDSSTRIVFVANLKTQN